ncbi:LRFN4 [Branchiostoma lanceolatum]|uniref:LRFN4 protein n=1 Tax=Branchiostoma lanceolatum TaxID=7740 RepID=A0A8J9W7X2_BRALA|nr:LRFN4 [Branchiostoma lanceolatum]
MTNRLKTFLILLLIVPRKTSACSSRGDCRNRGLRSVPQDLSTDITKFSLQDNSITILNESDFLKYTKLRKVDLSSNKLTYLQSGTFSGLPQLSYISLQCNHITNIDPGTFFNLPEIYYLNLNYNNLTNILPGTFTHLPELIGLFLAHNQITEIKSATFSDLPLLNTLLLAYNRIRAIQPGAFSNLPRLGRLILKYNLLTSIHPNAFSNLPNHISLELLENPWHCDCRMAAIRKTTTSNNHASQIFKRKIICQEPSNLHKKNFDDISPEDLICEKPKIMSFENNKGGTQVKGETLRLSCEASGIPKPDVTITLPSGLNATVESRGRVTVKASGSITITDVAAADAGQYTCIAANPGGSASDKLFVEVGTPTSVMPGVSIGAAEISDVTTSTSAEQPDGMMFTKPTIVRFKVSDNTLAQGETPPNSIVTLPPGLTTAVSRRRVTSTAGVTTIGVSIGAAEISDVTTSTSAKQPDSMMFTKPTTVVRLKVSDNTLALGETPPNSMVTLPPRLATAVSRGRVTSTAGVITPTPIDNQVVTMVYKTRLALVEAL